MNPINEFKTNLPGFIFNSIPIGLRNQFEETYGISYRLMYQDAYLQGLQRNTDIKNFGGGEGPG